MLNLKVKKLGTVVVLSLQGKIVNGETEILNDAMSAFSEISAVKLDLARVNAVDARGLGVMLELREQAQARGIRFELMNVSTQVSRILKIARLDSVFQISTAVEFLPAFQRSRRTPVPALASCA
ncbi:MAG TPA: STAS domain-containing protein [Pyrinomonadaceae bacterium]|jgi:anti-sigma B factor antagonist